MLTAPLLAFTVTVAVEPLVITALTRRGILDVPVGRSNHVAPTPRGGGIALVAGMLAGVVGSGETLAMLLFASVVIAAGVGLVEDVRGLSILSRLIGLALAAAVAALALITAGGSGVVLGMAVSLTLPWTLAVVNAVNFMDGIDGISAVTAIVGGGAYAVLGSQVDSATLQAMGLIVAAAGLGFAPYNVPRARVFLGDVGSYGLGAALSAISLLALVEGVPVVAATAPLAVYLADTGTTLLRRARAGEPWHLPHKQHVYQRLVALGLSHAKVSGFAGVTIAGCAGLGAISLLGAGIEISLAAAAAVLVVLAGYLASPRLWATKIGAL